MELNIFEEAILKTKSLHNKYEPLFKDSLKYRCDLLLMTIINDEGINLDPYNFSGDLCGLLMIDDFEKTIAYNSNHSATRRNFTLAHELGHYFLHSHKESQFVDRSKNLSSRVLNEYEMQANTFASHLLLPKHVLQLMLKNQYNFFKIAKQTQISNEALFWRIVNDLVEDFSMTRSDATMLVDEFKEYSLASIKNIASHKFALIYSLTQSNYLNLIREKREGFTVIRFEKDPSGEILGVDEEHYANFSENFQQLAKNFYI